MTERRMQKRKPIAERMGSFRKAVGRILGKAAPAVCLLVLLGFAFPAEARADVGGNDEKYTYTVTLLAGDKGSFVGAGGVQVSGSGSVSYQDSGEIRITGLNYGDRISVSPQSGMVELPEGSKYYIRGIRESGRDNNTAGNSSFVVDSDREYVVAYGIRGNMVSYRVNYEDQEGNALLESQTFYGAVGDRPVVAFQYVDGYQPQAYNLTGTLSSNEAENVFTFTYTETEAPAGTAQTPDGGTAVPGTGGGAPAAPGGAAQTPGTETPGTTEGAADAGAAGDGTEAAGGGTDAGQEGTVMEEPEQPEELVDIDEEEVPLANQDQLTEPTASESTQRPVGNMPVFAVIAVAAAAAVVTGLIVGIRKRR